MAYAALQSTAVYNAVLCCQSLTCLLTVLFFFCKAVDSVFQSSSIFSLSIEAKINESKCLPPCKSIEKGLSKIHRNYAIAGRNGGRRVPC
ncbi:uncharacterized protein FA14DRAFT_162805 [Meira miltonrushii]|uniref:Uncharacterized protein n=1 Tax=Meira miltonrushii TaxID=1280837 RepID=A0A316V185_9BASI|nr:uncharacterized protein FA14DRAFT_162805 [Meira miltonrushii]PWN31316.1 hypothetical protein FA14DRAFT_162805 [Meira miltonrushii]